MAKSISSNEIKSVRSLSQKKFRDAAGLFTVEGEKLLEEALKSGFRIEKIYRREDIGAECMSRISQLASPSPVLAVVRKPDDISVAGFGKGTDNNLGPGLYLALDSVRDPGNLGTIIRIADWFGINAIFASSDTADIFNSKTVQATMGAIFRVKFHYCDLDSLAGHVLERGGNVYGTFLDGKNIYSEDLDAGIDSPSLIIIGNESNGISEKLGARTTGRLYIPPYPENEPGSESLNAAIAAAVTIAEFRRRTYNLK